MFARLLALMALPALALSATPSYEEWRKQIMEVLHVPRPLPALNVQQHGHFQAEPGVTIERVSYSTQLGMRVPVILYRPERAAGRRPALIVVNGHGGDKYAWYAEVGSGASDPESYLRAYRDRWLELAGAR